MSETPEKPRLSGCTAIHFGTVLVLLFLTAVLGLYGAPRYLIALLSGLNMGFAVGALWGRIWEQLDPKTD